MTLSWRGLSVTLPSSLQKSTKTCFKKTTRRSRGAKGLGLGWCEDGLCAHACAHAPVCAHTDIQSINAPTPRHVNMLTHKHT